MDESLSSGEETVRSGITTCNSKHTHTQLRDESFHEYVCQLFMLYNSPMGVQMLPLKNKEEN